MIASDPKNLKILLTLYLSAEDAKYIICIIFYSKEFYPSSSTEVINNDKSIFLPIDRGCANRPKKINVKQLKRS